jgi:hypothetical protein
LKSWRKHYMDLDAGVWIMPGGEKVKKPWYPCPFEILEEALLLIDWLAYTDIDKPDIIGMLETNPTISIENVDLICIFSSSNLHMNNFWSLYPCAFLAFFTAASAFIYDFQQYKALRGHLWAPF